MATKATSNGPRKPRTPVLTLKPPPEIDPLEDVHQERVFDLARFWTREVPLLALLFHVPNGGYRRAREAAALQRRGVKSGVPDILLPVARGGFIGLAVELKRFREGQPTDEQKAWLLALSSAGWKCVLCRGWRAAWREIWRYVHLPATCELTEYGGSPTTAVDRIDVVTRKDTEP